MFTLVNVLEARDAAARNGAGWTVCLAELDTHLAGVAAAGPHSDGALSWRPVHEAHVEAGVPHGASIPTGAGRPDAAPRPGADRRRRAGTSTVPGRRRPG